MATEVSRNAVASRGPEVRSVMIQIFESDFNSEGLVQTVNARDLHEALGVKRLFANWIKDALHYFKENQDFIIFNATVNKSVRGRPFKEYAITLDCAKHICMMSRCEKGKQLRQYFIEAEKQFRLGLDQQPQAQPQVGYTQPQANPDALPGTPEHFAYTFALAYQQCFGGVQQAAQQPVGTPEPENVIEHEPETVVNSAGPGWRAVKAEQLPPPEPQYYNPCPSHKISMKGLKDYMSNERLIVFLMKKFNIKGGVHDYGYVKGQKAKPGIIYNKQQMLAILHAAYVLSKPHNDKQREFAGIVFTMKRVIKPELYDAETFDNAYDNLKEELNHH